MAFFDVPVVEIVKKVWAGELSARSIVDRSLLAIDTKNVEINAFITVCHDLARKRADEIDSLTIEERMHMPLCGIPVAVKDNIVTKGIRTTCASKMLETFIPPYDADVVERLIAAGAIIVGKTNMDEFAMGSSNENSAFGSVKNPRDLTAVPGGSSGGSAAAVAADMVPLSLGSDTGGSIRQPASHCGVVGMKPSYGAVSRYGLVAFASSLDQIGPIAQRVDDAELLLSVIAGVDNRDSTNRGKVYRRKASALSDITIGLPKEYLSDGLTPVVSEKIAAVRVALEKEGVSFTEISLPNVRHAIATYYVIATAEASTNLSRFDGVKYGYRCDKATLLDDMYCTTRKEGFGAEVKRRIMLGTYVLSSGYYDAYYLKATQVRTLIAKDFEEAFKKCDAILSPVTPAPAFKMGEKVSDQLQMYLTDIYTVSANLAGIPGISVPAGSSGILPIGAQFMTKEWNDSLLFELACAVEASQS